MSFQTQSSVDDLSHQPDTARTHDGVTGHVQPAAGGGGSNGSNAPPSPALSAIVTSSSPSGSGPTTGTSDETNTTSHMQASSVEAAPVPASTASFAASTSSPQEEKSEESKDILSSTQQLVLAATQSVPTALHSSSRPSSRPISSSSRVSSRSGRPTKLAPLAATNPATKLPFYSQQIVEPSPTTLQPLPPQHFHSLPLSAVLAHISRANGEGLEFLKQKEYQLAYERLRRAEVFCSAPTLKQDRTKSSISLRASTYNNLAILHKSINQLRPALWYANRALRLEINFQPLVGADGLPGPRPNPAGTHLNMCAILSSLGRHSSALLHAECALSSLYLELHQLAAFANARKKIAAQRAQARHHHHHQRTRRQHNEYGVVDHPDAVMDEPTSPSSAGSGVPTSTATESDKHTLFHLIAVALLNTAVEQEFLRQYRASTHSYRRAVDFARKRLGTEHDITKMIRHAYEGAVNLHPLKVIAPKQSMNPHTKLTVSNTAATAVSVPSSSSGMSRSHPPNKWLIPALENNPMTARHIPVRYVPFNQFVAVAGLPGRDPAAKHARHASNASMNMSGANSNPYSNRSYGGSQAQESKESATAYDLHDEGDAPHGDEYNLNGGDACEDDFGPPVTESQLRARRQQQQQEYQQPSGPPPNFPMNPEEPLDTSAAQDDEAGYWSDPELMDGPLSRSHGKTKQDPRLPRGRRDIRQSKAGGGGGADGSSSNTLLPQSASLGQLEAAAAVVSQNGGIDLTPFGTNGTQRGSAQTPTPRTNVQQQQQQQQQQQSPYAHQSSQPAQPYPPSQQPFPWASTANQYPIYGGVTHPYAPYPYLSQYQPMPSQQSTQPSFLPPVHHQQQPPQLTAYPPPLHPSPATSPYQNYRTQLYPAPPMQHANNGYATAR